MFRNSRFQHARGDRRAARKMSHVGAPKAMFAFAVYFAGSVLATTTGDRPFGEVVREVSCRTGKHGPFQVWVNSDLERAKRGDRSAAPVLTVNA